MSTATPTRSFPYRDVVNGRSPPRDRSHLSSTIPEPFFPGQPKPAFLFLIILSILSFIAMILLHSAIDAHTPIRRGLSDGLYQSPLSSKSGRSSASDRRENRIEDENIKWSKEKIDHCQNYTVKTLTHSVFPLPLYFSGKTPNVLRIPSKILVNNFTDNGPDTPTIVSKTDILKHFPGWEYILDDKSSCLEKIGQITSVDKFNSGEMQLILSSRIVPDAIKRDTCMLAQIYLEGGIYINHEHELTSELISDLMGGMDVVSVVGTGDEGELLQSVLGAPPGHPLIAKALEISSCFFFDDTQFKYQQDSLASGAVAMAMEALYQKDTSSDFHMWRCKGVLHHQYKLNKANSDSVSSSITTADDSNAEAKKTNEMVQSYLEVKASNLRSSNATKKVVDKKMTPVKEVMKINEQITLVGMTKGDDDITQAAIRFFLQAACHHGIAVYLMFVNTNDSFRNRLYAHGHFHYDSKGGSRQSHDNFPQCLNLIDIDTFPPGDKLIAMTTSYLQSKYGGRLPDMPKNNPLQLKRVGNIKRAREYQRQEMAKKHRERGISIDSSSSVVVLDVDMLEYPPIEQVIDVAQEWVIDSPSELRDAKQIKHKKYGAICANGMMSQKGDQEYYDTFATILYGNTWLYPKAWRFPHQKNLEGEDASIAELSQKDMLDLFLNKGITSVDTGTDSRTITVQPVRVRSCFGGLTIYRTDVWLNGLEESQDRRGSDACRYDMYDKRNDQYASKIGDSQACEHVIFHNCLARRFNGDAHIEDMSKKTFQMGVHPTLLTLYHYVGMPQKGRKVRAQVHNVH